MGCQSSREDISKEEHAITLMEEQLEYFKNTCKLVDFNLRKYSTGGAISADQWEDIVNFLTIKTKNSFQCPKTEEFYERFRLSNGHYRLKPLLTLGIMLSSGTPRQKAKLLFEMLDPNNTKELSAIAIEEMIDYMLDIAINYLPLLVSNLTYPPASEMKTKAYASNLADYREGAKIMLMKIFLNGGSEGIKLNEFQNIFQEEMYARLFFPYGLRMFVLKSERSFPMKKSTFNEMSSSESEIEIKSQDNKD